MAAEGQQQTMEAAEQTGMNPAVIAAGASVLLSWYAFFIQGDRLRGIFIGLWPPTFLAFASHFEIERLRSRVDGVLGKGSLMDRVERMMQAQ